MRERSASSLSLKISLALFSLVAIIAGVVWVIKPWDGLESAKQKAKAAGFPMSVAELSPQPGAPADKNAATLLLTYDLEVSGTKGFAEADAAGQEKLFMLANAKLNAMRPVLDKTYLLFERDWTLTSEKLFLEGAGVKQLIKDLTARADLHARQDRAEEAMKDLEVADHISSLLTDDVGLLGHLVDVAVHRIVDVAMMRIAARFADDPQKLAQIRSMLDARPFPDFKRALQTEAFLVVGTNFFQLPPQASLGFKEFQQLHLQAAIQEVQILDKHGSDLLKAADEMDAVFQRRTSGISLSPGIQLYKAARMPARDLAIANLRTTASRQVAKTYLDVLIERANAKRLPESLAELGGDRTDPFSGKPLRYKLENKGFLVWSIGSDQKDDGGKPASELKKTNPNLPRNAGDMVARWTPRNNR